ncbi:MAG: hypothetical protein JWR88_69 [Pseudonocardia sp.]|nr:hypothetical protein [Pseudonocardia sp.]
MSAGDPRGRTVPAWVTAELARAAELPLPELMECAAELARDAHPAAAAVWRLAARACAGDADSATDVALRARIDEGLGAALTISGNAESRALLARAVTAREQLGDPLALAVARGRAALSAAVGGDEAAAAVLHDIAPVIETHGTAEDRVVHLRRRAWATLLAAHTEDNRALGVALLHQAQAAATAISCHREVLACQAMLLELASPPDAGERIEAWQQYVDQLRDQQCWWRLGAASLRLAQERVVAGVDPDDADDAADVLKLLVDAVRYALEWGEPAVAAQAMYLRARLLVDLQRPDEARIAAFSALVRAAEIGDDQLAARSRLELGAAYGALGEFGAAKEILNTAVAATDPSDLQSLVRAGQLMGSTVLAEGYPIAAAVQFDAASDRAERGGELASAAQTAQLCAQALEQAGDIAQAVVSFGRAAELFARAQSWDRALTVRHLQADALVRAGRPDEAISALDAPLDGLDPSWGRANLEEHAARLLAEAGRGKQALARAETAEALLEAVGDSGGAACAAALGAQISLVVLADPVAAEESALRAVQLAAQSDDDEAGLEVSRTLAKVLDALAVPDAQ